MSAFKDIKVIIFSICCIAVGCWIGFKANPKQWRTKTPLRPTFEIAVDSTGKADTTFVYKLK
jgi:hypothetical protein